MQAALQQNPRPAKHQHLFDFFVNLFKRQNVAVLCANGPVKRAKRTILGAKIRIVDIAVDLVRHHPRIVFLEPLGVRLHPDTHQIIRLQHFNRRLLSQSHVVLPRKSQPAISTRNLKSDFQPFGAVNWRC